MSDSDLEDARSLERGADDEVYRGDLSRAKAGYGRAIDAYIANDDSDGAIRTCQKLLRLTPDVVRTRFTLVCLLVAEREVAGAMEALSDYVRVVRATMTHNHAVPRVSRASLLAGRLTTGAGADEVRTFKQHPRLVARSKASKLPLLFHKGSLAEGASGGLSEEVRAAIRDAGQQIIGVVVNVLDDSLAKSEQVVPRWTLDRIRLLEAILFEARLAGRIVVLTSDHGHVLDADSTPAPGGDEERWRSADSAPSDLEIVLSGPRIQEAIGAPEIVAPWSERVRYVRKKAGYHGGVTPQEMLVPVAVYAAWDQEIEGWSVASEQPPSWWTAEPEPITPAPEPAPEPRTGKKKGRATTLQASLFVEPVADSVSAPAADWISALLGSPAFAAQRDLAGRLAQPDETVRSFFDLMERYQGRMPRAALARALGQPEIRIRGILAGLQRLLNVDGYPIVSVDEVTDSITLQRDLLRKQFQVEA